MNIKINGLSIDEAEEICSTMAASDIVKLSSKDRLSFWLSILEFSKAKLQRRMDEPIDGNDQKIVIEYAADKT